MLLIVTTFWCLSGLELLLWLPLGWRLRKPLAFGLLVALFISNTLLIATSPRPWTVLLAVFSLYRLVNLRRLLISRIQPDYLYNAARRTSLTLIGLQILTVALAALVNHFQIATATWLYSLAAIQLFAVLILLVATQSNLRRTKPPVLKKSYAEGTLPSLTVAIPARNETTDLESCLQSLLSSDYPKLEILVLDDCSQNKRTPEIIRGFAHAGVRFIAGSPPPEHWLAKNYAYQQLADEANGEVLLFCGVDTRFQPSSLKAMVETLLQKRLAMLGLLPRNALPEHHRLLACLVQPARYAWELMLPRRLVNRPPVLSTCWLITTTALQTAGGFKAVSRGHSPESYFARTVQRQQNGYEFLQSNAVIGLTSAKTFDEQRATAIRTRYPQLHRRPEWACVLTIAELLILLTPFVLVIGSCLEQSWLLAAASGLTSLLLLYLYAKIVAVTYHRLLLSGLCLLPLAALYDIGLLNYSMWQYEFHEVIWKGRNVCIPLMRTMSRSTITETTS